MKKALMGAAAVLILAGASASAQEMTEYHIEGYEQNCSSPPEGIVHLGNGHFSITETGYDRIAPKKEMGDGWFEARYSVNAEGEEMGEETVQMKISGNTVRIRTKDRDYVAHKCR